jgi:hypothetical protein
MLGQAKICVDGKNVCGDRGVVNHGERTMRKIARSEWQSYCRHGYASLAHGQRFVLTLDKATQATTLEEVEIVGLGDRPAWAVTEADDPRAEIAGRRAAAAYKAGDSLG